MVSIAIHTNPDAVSDITNISSVAIENETNGTRIAAKNETSNGSSINGRINKEVQPKGSTAESKLLNT